MKKMLQFASTMPFLGEDSLKKVGTLGERVEKMSWINDPNSPCKTRRGVDGFLNRKAEGCS